MFEKKVIITLKNEGEYTDEEISMFIEEAITGFSELVDFDIQITGIETHDNA